jgi:signal transduction histidine kinase/CheY-like chemotaxis protein
MNAVSRAWRTWCDAFVPPTLQSDVDKERRARFIVAICTILVPLIALRAVTLYAAGMRGQSVAVLSVLGACLAAPWALRRTGSLLLSGNIVVAAVFVVGAAMSFQRGGIGAPMVIGLGALPLLAIFVAGARSGIVWTALVMLLVIALGAYEYGLGQPLADRLTGAARLRVEFVGALLFPLVILALGLAYEWTKNSALEARARAERERMQAEEASRMLQANRMAAVGQMAAGVAHEINNPLAYIAGNLEYIERELRELRPMELESARNELSTAAADARQGIDRVASIVRDLKTFARTDDHEVGVFDVKVALEASIRIAESEIRHRARLVREYPEEPTFVRVKEAQLVQVFLNLLVNAAHAIPPGNAEKNLIVVRVTSFDNRAQIIISDTGCGMTDDVLARAADPFFTTKPIGVGTGLGLSVCSNVVLTSGGDLHIESQVGKGTTITVQLPKEDAPVEPPVVPVSKRSAATRVSLRVLLIDDDPLVVRSLRRLLKTHDVTCAKHAEHALKLLEGETEFDLILCDLMMPDVTGAELYERVASWGRGIERQIVFITGGVFTEQMRLFLEQVPNLCVEKPIRADHLDAILARGRPA